jgi:hypothetical protein
MGSKFHRWRQRRGLASMILGLGASALLLVAGLGIFTYQQMVATRQVVTQTTTAALRAAVPQGFVGEALATSTSTQAAGLTMSATAYDQAVGQILPQFWPGSQVAPCTTTPAGSPVACTPGRSYVVTLPAVTARALHVAGPLVVANIQVAATPPYTLTHFGQTTTAPGPVVAADVAVPLHVSLGAVLTLRPWVETAITNVLYADQGGTTAAGSRFLPFGRAASGKSSATVTSPGFCWTYPDPSNPACAVEPAWAVLAGCPSRPAAFSVCAIETRQSFGESVTVETGSIFSLTNKTLPQSMADALPWIDPPSNDGWVYYGENPPKPSDLGAVLYEKEAGRGTSTAPIANTPTWAWSAYQIVKYDGGTGVSCFGGELPAATAGGAPVAMQECTNAPG